MNMRGRHQRTHGGSIDETARIKAKGLAISRISGRELRGVLQCTYQHGDPSEDVERDEPLPRRRRRRGGPSGALRGSAAAAAGLQIHREGGCVVAADALVAPHGARPPAAPPALPAAAPISTEEEEERRRQQARDRDAARMAPAHLTAHASPTTCAPPPPILLSTRLASAPGSPAAILLPASAQARRRSAPGRTLAPRRQSCSLGGRRGRLASAMLYIYKYISQSVLLLRA